MPSIIFRKILIAIALQTIFLCAFSQHPDSLKIKDLEGVTISEKRIKKELRSSTPIQTFDKERLEQLNPLQLSDAVKFFSGVTVKDYGGVGGLKTVSVRGLGAAHTGVSYDGISISDGQSGQVDLGRFSLNNISKISLSAGQNEDIFQPARLFASASVLNIQTATPSFSDDKKINAYAGIKAGSFGLWNPQIGMENRLGKLFKTSLNAEFLTSKGDYPYTLHYGASAQDSVSHEERENSDVETWHAEAALFGDFPNNGQLRVHAYYYQSERGLPSATTFYYKSSSQRLWDKNFFTQAHYEQLLNRHFSIQANGKYAWSFQRYRNPDYLGSEQSKENNYYQNEGYGSATVRYNLKKNWSFSLSNDFIYNNMNADLPSFANPERYTWLATLAGKYHIRFMTVTANLLTTVIREEVDYDEEAPHTANYGKKAPDSQRLSPAVSIAFRPFKNEELSFRLMYKEIFRMPSFNDLYYAQVGNPDLKPEYTWQYDAGITWGKEISSWLRWLSVITDVYFNKVENKIVAVPTKNIFEWSMQNVGKANIYGVDVNVESRFEITRKYAFMVGVTYSFQKALDVTSQTDPIYKKLYKHQLPYTPEHSGGGSISFENPFITVNYNVLYSGARYTLGQNIPENYLSPYTDQNLSFSKKITWGKVLLSGSFEILNLFDEQYEVVRYFPMQGRSYRIALSVKF